MRRVGSVLAAGAIAVSALVLLPLDEAWAQGVPVAEATPAQKQQAKVKLQQGKLAMTAANYEMALKLFRESYGIVASPNSHLMVVRALVALKRYVEAFDEARLVASEATQHLAQDPKYRETADAAELEQKQLEAHLGRVLLKLGHPTTVSSVTIGERTIARELWDDPIAVPPGPVVVVFERDGQRIERQGEVPAGATLTVDSGETANSSPEGPVLAPPPEESSGSDVRPLQVAGFATAGVGALGLLSFAIFGGLTVAEYGDLESRCAFGCSPEESSDADSGRSYQVVANVSLVVGLVGAAAGAGLLLYDAFGSSDEGADASSAAIWVGPGSMGLKGTF